MLLSSKEETGMWAKEMAFAKSVFGLRSYFQTKPLMVGSFFENLSLYKLEYIYIYFFFFFLGLHMWNMEVPRVGV